MNKHIKGSLLIITAMILFAFIGVFVRILKIKAELLLFYSSIFITIGLLIYYILSKRIKELLNKRLLVWYILAGFFLIGNLYSYFKAYSITTFANSVLSHYMAPIIAALSAPLIVNEKIEKITIKALIISILGLFLISHNNLRFSNIHLIGIAFGLISALFYGLSINIVKKLLNNKATPLSIIFYQSLVPSIVLIPFVSQAGIFIIKEKITLLALYTIFATFIPVVMFFSGAKYVKAQHTGILAYSEVIAAILFGFLLFKEIPHFLTIVGGILILFGGYLIMRAEAKRK